MAAVTKPTADPNKYLVGEGRACLQPNRANDRAVAVARPLPGAIVLVHGVNDLGVCYPAQEEGLCKGLNERLSRQDLAAAGYRLPSAKRDDKLEADPDAVYYRRDGQGYGPVIPFYWGYREYWRSVQTNTPHGQYLDRYGNRLDKSGSQGGGLFSNATSNLPDMWDGGFKAYGGLLNSINDDPTHPLRGGPDRRYMVLAAQRLAALVLAIRQRDANDTVTFIGHSQGCLLSLLAQAFLGEWGSRPVDCLILNHPPYGLQPAFLEKTQAGILQQTTRGRLLTLQNLVREVTQKPHPSPSLADLESGKWGGVCGPLWTAGGGRRPDPARPGQHLAFAERDNRGKVYLYFCPEDLTVGLDNVIGIGSFGVPEEVDGQDEHGNRKKYPALPALGQRFYQRIFTMRQRQQLPYPVGAPPASYCLREKGEDFHRYAPSAGAKRFRHTPDEGDCRRITGEALTPPCVPDLHHGEIANGRQAVDPIDASIAITNGGIATRHEVIADPRPTPTPTPNAMNMSYGALRVAPEGDRAMLTDDEERKVERLINQGKEPADSCEIKSAAVIGNGKLRVHRTETPNEARLRWQREGRMENSYHSAILANPEHSRHVHAFDVAIGQGEAINNPTYRELLLMIADWRVVTKLRPGIRATLLDQIKDNPFYAELTYRVKTLVEANAHYYSSGELPLKLIPVKPPAPIVSETLHDVQEKAGRWTTL